MNVPVGTTGLEFRYWARAGSFAATDEVQVQLSRDGGPFTTVETITSAASDGNYQFHNINFSWYPSTTSNVVIRFVSDLSTGELFVDNVLVRAHLAPITGNQVPIANAGLDRTVTDSNGDGVEAVTLDGAASSDPDGSIVSYQWHEGSSLLGEGATLNHSLGTGSHVVTLTVTDNGGASASDPVNVTVQGSAPAGSLASDDFESASFSGGTGGWIGG